MAIYKGKQKIAGYTSGRNSAIINNITITPEDFTLNEEDKMYYYVYESSLVTSESIVDIYVSMKYKKIVSKASVDVSSDVGQINFVAMKLPTSAFLIETIRIINPSQDDSYDESYSNEIRDLQNKFTNIDTSVKNNTSNINRLNQPEFEDYTETELPDIYTTLEFIKSKQSISNILQGIIGTLYNFLNPEFEDVEIDSDEYLEMEDCMDRFKSGNELFDIFTGIKNAILNIYSLTHDLYANKINTSDIVDNLLSIDTNKPLSANQGKVLKGQIDSKENIINHKVLDNTDFNTITTSGFYRISATSSSYNAPADAIGYGQLIVCHGASDTIAQIYFPYNVCEMYIRTGNPVGNSSGVWGSWRKVINKAYGISPVISGAVSSGVSPSTSIAITTNGRPVCCMFTGDWNPYGSGTDWLTIRLYRDSTVLRSTVIQGSGSSHNNGFAINYLDVVSPGTYTYKITMTIGSGSGTITESGENKPALYVFEI